MITECPKNFKKDSHDLEGGELQLSQIGVEVPQFTTYQPQQMWNPQDFQFLQNMGDNTQV
jgi:hypothetical protein